MCDYGRLNFGYIESETRLLEPRMFSGEKLVPVAWPTAIGQAAAQLKHCQGWDVAIIASGRMTNEEFWLTGQLAKILGVRWIDIVPRYGPGDDILLSKDRNPNTNGARLLGITAQPGAQLPEIVAGVKSGAVRALLVLGEDPTKFGISLEELKQLPSLIVMDILSNVATENATVVLPAFAFAEKRGSMINGDGRLQRLNRAGRAPGQARDDWEILRDLIQGCAGTNGIGSIDDVFRQMSETVPHLAGLSLSRISDLGVQVMQVDESPAPPPAPGSNDVEQALAQVPPERTTK
jgi:NADH-quinone oxidoreductase subunit G